MKKTFTINISGIIFHIDDDAYQILQDYLTALNNRFKTSEEGREVVADIEARIAELFQEKLSSAKQVVTIEDVNEVLEVLGQPEEFDEAGEEEEKKTDSHNINAEKRFFRDPDNRVIGGVCGGLGAYFNLDPVIIRVIFILALLIYGAGPVIYIILWIAIPLAVTTAQKLQMHGRDVNISNIERSINEEFKEVKKNFRKMRSNKNYSQTMNFIDNLIHVFGRLLHLALRFLIVIAGIVLIITGISMVLAFVGVTIFESRFMFFSFASPMSVPTQGMLGLVADSSSISIFLVGAFLFVGIPLLALIYGGLKILFKFKSNDKLIGITALTFWILGIVMTVSIVVSELNNFSSSSSQNRTTQINLSSEQTLFIKAETDTLYDSYSYYDEIFESDDVKIISIDDSQTFFRMPEFTIEQSSTEIPTMTMRYSSLGKSKKDAIQNADNIIYQWNINDSILSLEPYFSIAQNEKWRDQNLKLTLNLPVGYSVFLDYSVTELLWDVDNVSNTWDREMVGKSWIMKQEGLTLVN